MRNQKALARKNQLRRIAGSFENLNIAWGETGVIGHRISEQHPPEQKLHPPLLPCKSAKALRFA
jgi:hypothetical protein